MLNQLFFFSPLLSATGKAAQTQNAQVYLHIAKVGSSKGRTECITSPPYFSKKGKQKIPKVPIDIKGQTTLRTHIPVLLFL